MDGDEFCTFEMNEEWLGQVLDEHVADALEEIRKERFRRVPLVARIYFQEPDGFGIFSNIGILRPPSEPLILHEALLETSMKEYLVELGRAGLNRKMISEMGLPKHSRAVAVSISVEAILADKISREPDSQTVQGIPCLIMAARNEEGLKKTAVIPLMVDGQGQRGYLEDGCEIPPDIAKRLAQMPIDECDPLRWFFVGMAEGGPAPRMVREE